MLQVNILQAKNQLSQLIKYAQAGDEVVIANRGSPVVRLAPVGMRSAREPAQANFLRWLQDNPLPLHAKTTAQDIDASIAQERSAWE